MKVFVTGPDAADSFTHNVAHTFRRMGHDVRTDGGVSFDMQRSSLRRGLDDLLCRASERFRLRRDARTVRLAAEFKADLTVMCTMTLEPETVRQIRRLSNGPVVCWYGDAPANLQRQHLISGEYDVVFSKDADFVRVLRTMLGLEAHHLPEACNPDWHRPEARRAGESVVVAGTLYGYRAALAGRLLQAGEDVRLYGPPPGRWLAQQVRRAHSGVFLDHTTKARVFGGALACLSSFALSEGRNAVNCRIFETCACGGLLLSEERDAIAPYFDRDREYLAYGSFEECLDQLKRLRTDYGEAEQIRARAAKRAHAEHTYRQRLEKMLEHLEM